MIKWLLKNALKVAALTVLFFVLMFAMYAVTSSENMTVIMIGAAVMILYIFVLAVLLVWLLIRELLEIASFTPRPVRTELLGYGTEGLGRMTSAGLGSLLGGNLGMVLGFAAGGKEDVATFLVTYSNGKQRIESAKLNSLKYRQYLALQR